MEDERVQAMATGQGWRRGRWLTSDAEPVVLQSQGQAQGLGQAQGHAAMLVGARGGDRIVVLMAQALPVEHAYRVVGWTAAGHAGEAGTWFELESCMLGRRAGEQRLGHYVGVLRRVGAQD